MKEMKHNAIEVVLEYYQENVFFMQKEYVVGGTELYDRADAKLAEIASNYNHAKDNDSYYKASLTLVVNGYVIVDMSRIAKGIIKEAE